MTAKNIVVCQVKTPFVHGGAEIHVDNLCKELVKAGHNVELISIPFLNETDNQILASMINWRLINLTKYKFKKIDLVISTKFPTYYIEHDNHVCWLFHQYVDAYDSYGTEHSNLSEENQRLVNQIKDMDCKAFARLKKFYTVSKYISSCVQKHNQITSTPLYHPPQFSEGFYHAKFGDYFLAVGRLERSKRIDLLLKAMAKVKTTTRLIIAGVGPCDNDLKKLTNELGIDDRVDFIGFKSGKEMIELYANARAVLFAPCYESYGYVTIEAFLSRKPVLTTLDSGGPTEFVKTDINGLVVEPTLEAITKGITKLATMPETKLKEWGNAGYEKVKLINWQTVIEQLTE